MSEEDDSDSDVPSDFREKARAVLSTRVKGIDTVTLLTKQLWSGSLAGLEVRESSTEPHSLFVEGPEEERQVALSIDNWFAQRFEHALVWLNSEDYARALLRALWLAPQFAATDFGGSRQRDFAQVWTDTARGFLGELALQKFLKEKHDFEIALGTKRGKLEEFLPSDIVVKEPMSGIIRKPRLNLSIKATKFNGRWLDVPGAQFEHSDIFVLVKLGISRFHFAAFLKNISFLKDKLLPKGRELKELSESDSELLWNETPEFEEIPAYVCGFVEKSNVKLPIQSMEYRIVGHKNKRVVVEQGLGLFTRETATSYLEAKGVTVGEMDVVIDPIIDGLGKSKHFLANSGALRAGKDSWDELKQNL